MFKYIIILIVSIFFIGCSSEHKVRIISDIENAKVTIDSNKTSSIRIGYARFLLEEGEHTVLIEKTSANGEWYYKGEKTFSIDSEMPTNIEVNVQKTATQKRKDRLKKIAIIKRKKEDKLALIKEERRLKKWNSKEVFFDVNNSLVWQNTYPVELRWQSAKKYCENLEFSKSKRWRLPTKAELQLVNKLDNNIKNKISSLTTNYWSSNTDKTNSQAYIVQMKTAESKLYYTKYNMLVRCVTKTEDRIKEEGS